MAKNNKAKQLGAVRIIAGQWRGRKLAFPNVDGLRPTPDRVRETVFNWLQVNIGGAHCVDLFAGSGALGFEAASRGAGSVTMVESNSKVAMQLGANAKLLSAADCQVENKTAQQFLAANSKQYDIAFIDPPYSANLWRDITKQLVESGALAAKAMIYLECASNGELPAVPSHWQLIKDNHAGEVRYCLFLHDVGDIG